MYFTKTDSLHELEELMQGIPNFSQRGHGSIISKCEVDRWMEEQPPPTSYEELMTATVSAIHYKPFWERLKQYIKESERKPMTYRNDKHISNQFFCFTKQNWWISFGLLLQMLLGNNGVIFVNIRYCLHGI